MRSTLLILLLSAASSQAAGWLDWSASQAQSIGKSTFQPARIGGGRVLLNTERARSYKLGVTWLTPDVIRASIRLHQLSRRLDDPSAEALATEALKRRDLVFMVDIDPDEGSGVIPLDWQALIRVVSPSVQVPPLAGTKAASLRGDPAFAGVLRRNYDYDRFWITFPMEVDGRATVPDDAVAVELIVSIYDRETVLRWPVPESVRAQFRHAQ